MKVLEIIHLQSGAGSIPLLSDQVRASLRRADERSRTVAIYRRDGVVNDLAVHIQYTGRSKSAKQTELGLRLAAALREYGIVEHTVWTEI